MRISLRTFALAGTASFLFAQMLFAQTANRVVFVTAEQLNAASILPSPPSTESAETAAELAVLHTLEHTRTAAEVARAQKDDVEEDIFLFKEVLGERFTREQLPLTAAFSDHVHGNESVIINPAKNSFKRPRPYHLDRSIKPVCKVKESSTDYAYPSGHATSGYLEALALALIVPEKRDAILIRADEYAHNRLVCGVHYLTDVIGSKQVAYAMIGLMMNNQEFKKELEAAQKETRQTLGLEQIRTSNN